MTGFLVAACGVLGLLVGSFLNVVVWRVPRGESVVRPRSRCPGCGNQLRGVDNIPVVSWLALRGRCHFCGQPVSARYPMVELATGVLFAAAALRFGYDWALPAYLALLAGLVALSAIDIDCHRLPNKVLYPTLFATSALLVAAAVATGEWGDLARAAAGGAIGFGLFFLIHFISPRGMAFGDVRLAGVVGVALGWLGLAYVLLGLFLAFLTSSLIALTLIATGVTSRKDKIPFGPFLALGCLLAVLWGAPLLRWYGV
jgi:leader peptidase (prepilin peptidase)/N-methyltransferase